jgi:hypothetical protein
MTTLSKDEVLQIARQVGVSDAFDYDDFWDPMIAKVAQLCRADLVAELNTKRENEAHLFNEIDSLKAEVDAFDKAENSFMRKAVELEAELAALRGSGEVVEYRSRMRPLWGTREWTNWVLCKKEQHDDYTKTPILHDWQYEAQALYTHPQPSAVPVVEQMLEALEDVNRWRSTGQGRPPEQTSMDAIQAGQQWLKEQK